MAVTTSALSLASSIRGGQVGALELLEACLEATDRFNPDLNAVIWRNDDEARRQASHIDHLVAHGGADRLPPFAGVPMPVKDLSEVRGWPLTYGSQAGPGTEGRTDELAVERLREAGFVLCGRTNAPEFGTLPVTENRRYGITRNPWDLERSPGGSSGGAAAAVAVGMFPLAHGTDGGGSIRIPASCCGLVGLKPSRARVPERVAGWMGMTAAGVLTRTVADTAAALDCLAGPAPGVWHNAPPAAEAFASQVGGDPGSLRVGLLYRSNLDLPTEEEPHRAVLAAAALLEEAGHQVEEVDFGDVGVEALALYLTVLNAGYGELEDIDWTKAEPHNVAARQAAADTDSLTLVHALSALQRLSSEVIGRWGRQFDVLLTPTMAIEPPPAGQLLGQLEADPTVTPYETVAMAMFTALFNITGQPAISLPVEMTDQGVPLGIQLVGAPWDEATLLRLGAQLEERCGWQERHPPLLKVAAASGRPMVA